MRKACVNSGGAGRCGIATAAGSGDNHGMQPADDPAPIRIGRARSLPGGYLLALLATAAAVLAAGLAQHYLGLTDLSLVFMLAVLLVAARTDTGPAMLAAVLSFLGYNFFFIEPRYTLYIEARHAVATVMLFLAAALVAGRLASRLAQQLEALREANRHARARQALSQQLALATDEAAVLEAARQAFAAALDARTWLQLAPSPEPLQAVPAQATREHQGWWFLPLTGPDGPLGTLGLHLREGAPALEESDRDVARAMAADVSQALLRTRLAEALAQERIAREAERTRSALLASVSHDLRTPLASIIGAAESLESFGDGLPRAERGALLDTIREEGQRLDRYIQNLLDMTRLGHGSVVLRVDWIGIDELIGAAVARLRRARPQVRIEVAVPPGLPPVCVHGPLLEQAIYNLLDNAAKFAGAAGPVRIEVAQSSGRLDLRVRDAGPGIPDGRRQRVFEMFDTDGRGDRKARGSGLGLAICRAIAQAHGGGIEAEAVPRGASLRLWLPAAATEAA